MFIPEMDGRVSCCVQCNLLACWLLDDLLTFGDTAPALLHMLLSRLASR
jgi:hypothetical protein